MSKASFLVACMLAFGLGADWSAAQTAAGGLPLRLVKNAPLGQATTRYDYESLDTKAGHLFVADLGNGSVLVFDVGSDTLTKTIGNLPSVHGVLAVPEEGKVFATVTGTDELAVIDARTLSVVARHPIGHYPNAMAWAPSVRKLYVADQYAQAIAVVDGASNRLLKMIPVGGDVGNVQFDTTDGLIYANDQSSGDLLVVDPKTDAITARYRLPGCARNHGLLIDSAHQRAYIACQANARLVVFALQDHRTVSSQPIGTDPDVLAADPGLQRLYVAGEGGLVSAFDVAAPVPVKIGEAKLADNAHIVGVDPATHRVYFPLRDVGGRPVMRIMEPG